MQALVIPELNRIKTRDFDTWSALAKLVAYVNLQQSQAVIGGQVPAPAQPVSFIVSAIGGGFSILLGAPLNSTAGLLFFVEVSTVTMFTPTLTQVYSLGGAKGFTAARDGVTTFYFRCRCKYEGSGYSPYLYWGSQANPLGVI